VQQYETDGNRNVRIKRLKSVITKKRRFVQNAKNIGLIDTVFEELVSEKSFIETCNFLRSHAIRLDHQYKEKDARQNHNASQC
jgi:hypothetical protein